LLAIGFSDHEEQNPLALNAWRLLLRQPSRDALSPQGRVRARVLKTLPLLS
jgi:hypothetical protein